MRPAAATTCRRRSRGRPRSRRDAPAPRAGVPSASTSPWFIASTRSDTRDTSVMSCSTISTVMPSSLLDVLDPERHVVGLLDVQARRRLVEQQQLGLGAQRARQLDHLAHAVGQPGHHRVAVVLQVEQLDHPLGLARAPRRSARARRGREEQVAPEAGARGARGGRSAGSAAPWRARTARCSGRCARCPARRSRAARCVGQRAAPRTSMLAGGRRVDAADQVEHRGLAGAVGPDQREHLAALHVEADLVDGQHAAEAHAQVARPTAATSSALISSRSDFVKDFCRLNMPAPVEREQLQVGAQLEPAAVQAQRLEQHEADQHQRRRPGPAGPAPGRSPAAGSPC